MAKGKIKYLKNYPGFTTTKVLNTGGNWWEKDKWGNPHTAQMKGLRMYWFDLHTTHPTARNVDPDDADYQYLMSRIPASTIRERIQWKGAEYFTQGQVVSAMVTKYLAKQSKFTNTETEFLKKYKQYIKGAHPNIFTALQKAGGFANEGAKLNLNAAKLDRATFDKMFAASADGVVAQGGDIANFAYITPKISEDGKSQIGMRLMFWNGETNTQIAEFESGGPKDRTKDQPSEADKSNYITAAQGFEYYKGRQVLKSDNPKVKPVGGESKIDPNIDLFTKQWEESWGKQQTAAEKLWGLQPGAEKGTKTNFAYEIKGQLPNVASYARNSQQFAQEYYDELEEDAGTPKESLRPNHPCKNLSDSTQCAKKLTASTQQGVNALATAQKVYHQVYYTAGVFNHLLELDLQDKAAIERDAAGKAKNKAMEGKKGAEKYFKEIKETVKAQVKVNKREGTKQANKSVKKIDADQLGKEEIEASQRANLQCALLMNLNQLANTDFVNIYTSGRGKRNNNNDVVRVYYSGDKDQNQIMNKLQGSKASDIEPFLNITPEIVSAMTPMIRLFKVRTDSGKLVETEFAFESFTNQNPERKTFTLDDVDRGDGVGIKEFSFSFHGGNPALSRKDIKAKLVMYFQSFQDFIKPRDKGKYRFVDLMLFGGNKPGEKVKKLGFGKFQIDQYDPSYYRIRADVGWSIREDYSFRDLVAARDHSTSDTKSALKKFNRALENINQSLFLNMVEHNIDLRKDGTVMVTAEYQAYIESATKTTALDALSTPNLLKMRDQLNQDVESVLFTKCEDNKSKNLLGSTGRENLLAQASNVEEIFMEVSYQSIMRRLIERNLINVRYIQKSSIDSKNNPGKFKVGEPKLLTPAQAKPIIDKETTNPANNKKKNNKSAKAAAKKKATVESVFKLLPPNSALMQLNYFYVNDLVDVIMDSKLGIKGETRPELKKTKIILGSFERDGNVYNIGALPVSTQYFFEWFTNNVISKELKTFPVMTFIRSLTNHLINDMLNEACTTEKSDVSLEFRTTTAFGMKRRLSSKGKKWIAVNNIKPLRSFVRRGETANDAYHYLIVYAMKSGRDKPHIGKGNKTEDAKKGVYHLHVGQNRGIVKHISFEKTDIPYSREARYMRHGFDGLGQIAAVYNANIEMIGNTIFYPGMMVYVDPIGIGGRGFDPTNIKSEANALGFGGYHLVTKVDCSITPAGFKTTVKAMFNYSGEKEQKAPKRSSKDGGTSPLMPTRTKACSDVIGDLQELVKKWYLGQRQGFYK